MATIKDVAKETGLAVGTISRILNNRGYISEKSRKKVEDAMHKLGYQPNELARSLSKQDSIMIGVIVPHIDNPYFSNLLHYLEKAASKSGYQILLYSSEGEKKKEIELIAQCHKNRVAGIILCSGKISTEKLYETGLPFIAIECEPKHCNSYINCDNKLGGQLAAQLLINKGCRHLLHVSGIYGKAMPADKRAAGFAEICEKNSIKYKLIKFTEQEYALMDYHSIFEKIQAEEPETDGVFTSSDVIAIQLLQYCHRKNIKIPEQLKIVGFDDIYLSQWSPIAITTIHQPQEEMAEMAVKMLIDVKEGRSVPRQINMPVELVERETT